jgi:hypothetical protein
MPNHVTNILTIKGPSEEVAFVKKLISDAKDEVDFNILVPMPDICAAVSSGSSTIDGDLVHLWVEEAAGETRRKLTPVEEIAVLAAGGDWYSWSINHWGTKWNAYNQDFLEADNKLVISGITITRTLIYTFRTAWSLPEPWLIQLCARVPADVTVFLEWADEDFGSNTGYVLKNDEGYEKHPCPDGSEMAMDHAAKILGYDPREDDAEEAYERTLAEELPEEPYEREFDKYRPDGPENPTPLVDDMSRDKLRGPAGSWECPADWEEKVY